MSYSLIQTALAYDAFRIASAAMYVIFALGLYNLGATHQEAVVKGTKDATQFPPGYFTMLAAQLLPLTLSGFLLSDLYLMGTRAITLAVVLLVYSMATTATGTFNTWRHKLWLGFWLSVFMIGPLIWASSPALVRFVEAHETWIVWFSVAVMVLFVVKGQFEVAKALFKHFILGNYTLKRFSLQIVRFLGFALQAVHYWYMPSAAKPIAMLGMKIDPIFMQGAIGSLGVAVVLVGAVYGMARGTGARRAQKRAAREAARERLSTALATA